MTLRLRIPPACIRKTYVLVLAVTVTFVYRCVPIWSMSKVCSVLANAPIGHTTATPRTRQNSLTANELSNLKTFIIRSTATLRNTDQRQRKIAGNVPFDPLKRHEPRDWVSKKIPIPANWNRDEVDHQGLRIQFPSNSVISLGRIVILANPARTWSGSGGLGELD